MTEYRGQGTADAATATTTSILQETATATASQTVFNLSSITYTPGLNELSVYVNGLKKILTTDYTETSSTVVTFGSGLNVNDAVEFVVFAGGQVVNTTDAALAVFTHTNTGAAQTTIAAAMQAINLDTATELKATSGAAAQIAQTRGLSTVGDGGGGFYYWDKDSTATDDSANIGNTIQQTGVTTGRWLRLVINMQEDSLNNLRAGSNAGDALTTAANSVLIGVNAGTNATTGGSNVAIGLDPLESLVTGTDNVAIGSQAMDQGDTSYVVAIGSLAGRYNNGLYNVLIGHKAGGTSTNITGASNVGIGREALEDLTTGSNNVAVGYVALSNTTTGQQNTAAGVSAGAAIIGGAGNALFGNSAGSGITTGDNNVVVGRLAGTQLVGGDKNIVIGYLAGPTSNQSDKIFIDSSGAQTDTPMIGGDAAADTVSFAPDSANISGQFDDNATAGNTRFLVYDVDNATLERVSVGAADSGGSGFKVLRIPN